MARAWGKDDSVLLLAAVLDRPRHFVHPPELELERIASILRRDVDEVREHVTCFLDAMKEKPVACRDGNTWREFREDPVGVWDAADRVVESRKGVPYHLRKRL